MAITDDGRMALMTEGWRRLAWFVGLWAAGVAAVTMLAMAIRFFVG